jgi:hypothetical protein
MLFLIAAAACAPGSPIVPSASLGAVVQSSPSAPPALTQVPLGSSPSPSTDPARTEAARYAADVATAWVAAMRTRDVKAAWALLSDASQAAYGSLARFTADRNAFMDTAKGVVNGPSVTADPQALADWLSSAPGANADSAFIATVDYPALADRNNGQEILVVALDRAGTWRIWVVR